MVVLSGGPVGRPRTSAHQKRGLLWGESPGRGDGPAEAAAREKWPSRARCGHHSAASGFLRRCWLSQCAWLPILAERFPNYRDFFCTRGRSRTPRGAWGRNGTCDRYTTKVHPLMTPEPTKLQHTDEPCVPRNKARPRRRREEKGGSGGYPPGLALLFEGFHVHAKREMSRCGFIGWGRW